MALISIYSHRKRNSVWRAQRCILKRQHEYEMLLNRHYHSRATVMLSGGEDVDIRSNIDLQIWFWFSSSILASNPMFYRQVAGRCHEVAVYPAKYASNSLKERQDCRPACTVMTCTHATAIHIRSHGLQISMRAQYLIISLRWNKPSLEYTL